MARTATGPTGRRDGPPRGTVAQPGRIRNLGPILVLAVPLGLLLVAGAVLTFWPCEGTACGEPFLGAWGLVLFALPLALVVGLPWIVAPLNLALAIVGSLALWVTFGRWAARRATEDVDATWAMFWREVAVYAGGVVLGVLGGLLLMVIVLTVL